MPSALSFQSIVQAQGGVTLTWSATVGQAYQVQFKSDLTQAAWTDLGAPIVATNTTCLATDAIGTNAQRFYRLGVQP